MSFKKLSFLLAAYLLIGLFLVATASHYIRILNGEPIVVSGTLRAVSWDEIGRRDYGLILNVDGHEYNIIRRSAFSHTGRLNYGIEGDGMAEDVRILMRQLQQRIGWETRLEYMPLAEKTKLVVRLTIEDVYKRQQLSGPQAVCFGQQCTDHRHLFIACRIDQPEVQVADLETTYADGAPVQKNRYAQQAHIFP